MNTVWQALSRRVLPALTLLVVAVGGMAAEPPRVAAPKLVAALQPLVDNHTIAGAVVLAASPEKILGLEAVGYADLAARRPMRTDCLFWIASQSKPIVATAVMMLVDQGKLSLADPVEKYLPEFKGQQVLAGHDGGRPILRRPRHPITVRNLLTHTTGLPYKSPVEEPTLDVLPLAARVRSYAGLPLEFEPGSKYQYSNAGMNTAARIVEVVSGLPYWQYLDQRLFQPLGMKDTTFWPNAEQVARLAKSYQPTADKKDIEETTIFRLRYPLDDRSRQMVAGSGLFSTATDISLFYRMIANHGVFGGRRYLSERAVKEMTSKQTGDLRTPYGLGFSTDKGLIGHGGSYNTHTNYDPQGRLITILLTQQKDWRNAEGRRLPELVRRTAADLFTPADLRGDDAAILLPGDPPTVRQARRDLLLDIRRRYAPYSGAEMGGPVDMFLRNDPVMDRKANEKVLAAVRGQQLARDTQLWAKNKSWDGEIYPEEQQLLEVYFRYRARLAPQSRQAIEELWRQSLFTDREARERGPQWRSDGAWYWTHADASIGSNWGLIAAAACILGGQVAQRPDFVAHGKQALERWFPYTSQSGMISQECNLMEGHWRIYSFVLVQVAQWADDPGTRRLARLLLERIWLEKLIYFHRPTLRECGASGRCVATRQGEPVVDTNQRMWLSTQLDATVPYTPPPPKIDRAQRAATAKQAEPYLVSSWRIPDYLQDVAWRKALPQVLRSTCDVEVPPLGGTYPPQHPPLYPNPLRGRWQSNQLYTYLTESFALGSMSRDWVDVGMPALAFWNAHEGQPRTPGDHRAVYFRYQHDDRKPFGRATAWLRGRQVPLPLDQGWAEYGRHAAMQDHGRAILLYRPRLDYLRGFDAVPGLPGYISFDGDLSVTSLQALACFYREDAAPRGFYIGKEPVRELPAVVGRGQWVFVDDGCTWVAVYPLAATDLGGSRPPRLVPGDRHVFLQVDNWRTALPAHPEAARLLHCRSGFLLAIGDRTDYANFDGFRRAMLDSKIEERSEGNADRVQWTAGAKTLRLGWDAYEDRYLERSVEGATQDPWPSFRCEEYAQGVCEVRRGRATATTRSNPQKALWLLALDAVRTYVVYQPYPGQVMPLALDTPVGRASALNFPFGKLVLRKPAEKEPARLEIDAEYPAHPAFAAEVEVQGVQGPLTATINGQPAAVCRKDQRGVWHVSPEPGDASAPAAGAQGNPGKPREKHAA